MELIEFNDYLKNVKLPSLVVTIGDFDGIHLAHQQLLEETIKIGKLKNAKTAVITFSPHPDVVLKNKKNFELTSLIDKLCFFNKWDFDYLIVIPFTNEFSKVEPKTFIEEFLIKINVNEVVVGSDFSYGKYGIGKPIDIPFYSNGKIHVNIIKEILYENKKISSTDVRIYLENGQLEFARFRLGRNFSFSGEVVLGNQIGRSIDLPTANLKVADNFINLKQGVYAVKVYIDQEQYYGMMNIGHNPSFNYSYKQSIEVNIFDFAKNIYGKKIVVECFKYIREEIKFDSKEQFIIQIKKDREEIFKYFDL